MLASADSILAMRSLSGNSVATWEKIVQQMAVLRNAVASGAFKLKVDGPERGESLREMELKGG